MKNKMKLLLMVSILPISVFAEAGKLSERTLSRGDLSNERLVRLWSDENDQKNLDIKSMVSATYTLRDAKSNKVISHDSKSRLSIADYERLSPASKCTIEMAGYIENLMIHTSDQWPSKEIQEIKKSIRSIYENSGNSKINIKLSEEELVSAHGLYSGSVVGTSVGVGDDSRWVSINPGSYCTEKDFLTKLKLILDSKQKSLSLERADQKKNYRINATLAFLESLNKPDQTSPEANKSSTPLHDNTDPMYTIIYPFEESKGGMR